MGISEGDDVAFAQASLRCHKEAVRLLGEYVDASHVA